MGWLVGLVGFVFCLSFELVCFEVCFVLRLGRLFWFKV